MSVGLNKNTLKLNFVMCLISKIMLLGLKNLKKNYCLFVSLKGRLIIVVRRLKFEKKHLWRNRFMFVGGFLAVKKSCSPTFFSPSNNIPRNVHHILPL